ncbi:MAG: acetylxylan esterase [Cyclobacteriaceae bacterium]|nr:acetylxylan esterase [Cyclobacteriaceae bacterium]
MKNVLLLTLLLGHTISKAQLSQASRDSISRISVMDHQQMKQQLGITVANRPGPSGNPEAPNAANRDESKVNKYVLPDPLILKNGVAVKSPKDWWEKRRPEIVEDFDREVYGRLPKNVPAVTWRLVSVKDTTLGNYPIKEKTLTGIVDNTSFPGIKVEIELVLVTPINTRGPVPVVMEFGFIRWPFGNITPVQTNRLISAAEPGWKEQLIARGWGYAILNPTSIQADNGAGLRQGIIGLVNKGEPRRPDDWGALRAWAWGASRAVDYFETDADVDEKRLAIEGLSRYGKAAVLAMAYEPRFSLAFVGSSGAGGTKILRRVFGEQVENLAGTGEYHWFCGNFIKYASTLTPDDLPVDAHELVALCAPRPVFISSGSPQVEGQWVDAKGMFLGAVHAGPVYKLLGGNDLATTEFPIIGTPLVSGDIAFRQHAGGHSTGPNWSTWISWACRYWGDCKYF